MPTHPRARVHPRVSETEIVAAILAAPSGLHTADPELWTLTIGEALIGLAHLPDPAPRRGDHRARLQAPTTLTRDDLPQLVGHLLVLYCAGAAAPAPPPAEHRHHLPTLPAGINRVDFDTAPATNGADFAVHRAGHAPQPASLTGLEQLAGRPADADRWLAQAETLAALATQEDLFAAAMTGLRDVDAAIVARWLSAATHGNDPSSPAFVQARAAVAAALTCDTFNDVDRINATLDRVTTASTAAAGAARALTATLEHADSDAP